MTIQIDKLSTKPKTLMLWGKMTDFLTFTWLCRDRNFQTDENTLATTEDADVDAENERVQSGEADADLIVLKDLSKVYPSGKRAVNHMSLGIPPGEISFLL